MISLLLGLIIFTQNAYGNEAITEEDRFIDRKTGKYLRVCEVREGELIVKESCGKYWDKFPRKREDLIKEVKTYKDLTDRSIVMIPIKNKDGNIKMVLGKVSYMYENGRITVMEYYSKRFGFSPGTTNWIIDYKGITKLNANHPLLKHSELCAKDDTEINYNYDDDRKFKIKKGERVKLKGIFENNTAAIFLNNLTENFLGYGLDNQLPLDLSKLEVCYDDKEKMAIDDSSRSYTKSAAVEDINELPTTNLSK